MQFDSVLITGCGGDIAISIAKILKEAKVASQIIGSDIHDDHPGEIIYDQCIIVPKAQNPEYFSSISHIIKQYSIDVIIPTSENEIYAFDNLRNKEANRCEFDNIPVIIANKKAIKIGKNKLSTARFLEKKKLLFPWTIPVSEGLPNELPCIIKNPQSQGNKEVYLVNSETVNHYSKYYKSFIWQELLLPDSQEYTCGLYRSQKGETRTIILRRKLGGGVTASAQVIVSKEIETLLIQLAKYLELQGSINIQLRLTERGPVIFEINPRFSSTVRFRHLIGFKDLIWSLQEQHLTTIESYNSPKPGIRFYRLHQEIIIED